MIMPVQELEGQLAQVTAHKEAAVQELATAMAAQVEAIATVEEVWAAEPAASGGWPSLLPLPKLAWPAVSLANSPGLPSTTASRRPSCWTAHISTSRPCCIRALMELAALRSGHK